MSPINRVDNSRAIKAHPRTYTLAVGLLILVLAVAFLSSLWVNRRIIFDDSFISYQYSRNLANGTGLVFNTEQGPVEGYTNFLLVLLLAPVIKLGGDPLLFTQLLSIGCVLVIGAIMSVLAMEQFGMSSTRARLLAAALSLNPAGAALISMLGLETLLYTALLFGAFLFVARFMKSGKLRHLFICGILSFLAFLTRPEVVLFISAAWLVVVAANKGGIRDKLNISAILGLSFVLPLLIYIAWKQMYFGSILPNPFYIKAQSSDLISTFGLLSVVEYVRDTLPLIIVAAISLYLLRRLTPLLVLCTLYIVLHIAFYLHVDTLMNMGNRFLYPITPFIVILTLPLVSRLLRWAQQTDVEENSSKRERKQPVGLRAITVVVVLAISFIPFAALRDVYAMTQGETFHADSRVLMNREYTFARELQSYPDISNVRIAFSDAGVISYFTDAHIIDIVGLNDKYIAREREREKLLSYVFGQQPTIFVLPSDKKGSWLQYGHGPLGDYLSWADDARWCDYIYVGTVVTNLYDLQLLARKDYTKLAELKKFLKGIVDVVYEPFPFRLGTNCGNSGPVPLLMRQ
jgi:hypothetical protein